MRSTRIVSAAMLAFAFTACESFDELADLEVINENAPDRARAIQEAGDVESLISSSFATWYEGSYWGNPAMALHLGADEGTMSWGNFGGQQLSSEPRVAWPNTTSWGYRAFVEAPWYSEYEALSSIYDGLLGIENDPTLCDEIDCDRARA